MSVIPSARFGSKTSLKSFFKYPTPHLCFPKRARKFNEGIMEPSSKSGRQTPIPWFGGGIFKETQSYIQELGIVADIDPTKFDEFEVTHVPTFILSIGDKHDKMVGNVSLNTFLEQASQSGDLLGEASDLYKKLDTRVYQGG